MAIYPLTLENTPTLSIPSSKEEVGFGEHRLTPDQILAYQVQWIAIAIISAIATAGLFALTVVSNLFIPAAILMIVLTARASLQAWGYGNIAPSTDALFHEGLLPKMGKLDDQEYSGLALKDSVEGYRWKMELIRKAEKSIVMSGCYCGGKPFDDMLDLIGERLKVNQELTVSLLFSSSFITKENEQRLEELNKAFPERFSFVSHPEVFPYVSPATGDLSITSNHTKALIIDYGMYFMIGGSGVVSSWTDHPSHVTPPNTIKHNLAGIFGPSGFRDMDFVFHSPNRYGMGARLYAEMQKLIWRMDPKPITEPRYIPFHETEASPFHFEEEKIEGIKISYFATGPEQTKNPYLEEIIKEVRNAKRSIVINNLYFHPSRELLQALIDASNRGVKIQVLTNSFNLTSPYLHYTYAELSKYYMQALYKGKSKENVEIFEYNVPDVTQHKKVFVFDEERVLTGSANIGYKSLEGKGDYELNLSIHSEEFAASVLESMKEDMRIASKIPQEAAPSISLKTRVLSALQFPLKYVAF